MTSGRDSKLSARQSKTSKLYPLILNEQCKMDNSDPNGNSIPIYQRIMHPDRSICKRLYWSSLVASCIGLCCWLLYIKMALYLDEPTVLNSDPIWNKTVIFPAVTLCPVNEPFENDTVHYKWFKELETIAKSNANETADFEDAKFGEELNFTLQDIWEASAIQDDNIRIFSSCTDIDGETVCNYQEGVETTVKNSTYDTFWGQCRLFIPELPMEYRGPSTFLKIILEGYQHYKIHNAHGIKYAAQYIIHDHDTIHIHDAYLLPACLCLRWLNTVEMAVKQNKTHRMCDTARRYSECYNRNLDEELDKVLNCSLPFLKNSKRPLCHSWRSAKEAHKRTKQFYNSFKFDATKCLPPCEQTVYVKHLVKMKVDDSVNRTLLNLEYADNQFEHVKEVDLYGLTAFLGDATAFLGFFLGICMLSVFEMVEGAVEMFVQWRPKR